MKLLPQNKRDSYIERMIIDINGKTFSDNASYTDYMTKRLEVFASDITREVWENIKTKATINNAVLNEPDFS